ncbi:MAG: DnaJ domain-containing protein [Xanthobacteraceae bacterium]
MSDKMALRVAIDLLHVPSQVRLARSEPLPRGVPVLLRIAAGDEAAEREAANSTVRSREVVRRAAAFFIEQILFAPDTDSYRVLGSAPQAGASELRGNAALLLKWLHPDRDPHGKRSIFVSRVTEAWNNLKTPERRAAYDELRRSSSERKSLNKAMRRGNRKKLIAALRRRHWRGADAPSMYDAEKVGFFRRALSMLLQRPV